MREIKFRGKRAFIGGWIYGVPDIQGNNIEIFNREDDTYTKAIIIPRTLGQFTEFYDKNGNEIYEGDVLKSNYKDFTYWVVFEKGGFHIYNDFGRYNSIEKFFEILKEINIEIEIIGNIHENPELLEQ